MFARLGVTRGRVKPIGAWVLERLATGVAGKAELWRTLIDLRLSKRVDADFEALAARADAQRATIGELHQLAVAALVTNPPD